jgi:hypothetical protein
MRGSNSRRAFLRLRRDPKARIPASGAKATTGIMQWSMIRARSARPCAERHPPQSRDSGRCFPPSYNRGATAQRAGCRLYDRSGRPSCAASSACRKTPALSRCFQPSDALSRVETSSVGCAEKSPKCRMPSMLRRKLVGSALVVSVSASTKSISCRPAGFVGASKQREVSAICCCLSAGKALYQQC